MSHGKYQNKRKPFPIIIVLLIALLVAVLSTGGAVAYLAKSADSLVENTFETASNPTLSVNDNSTITVGDIGYAVYLRAAVVPNWKYNGQIIPAAPGEFTIKVNTDWFLHTDGFYYYRLPVKPKEITKPIYTEVVGTGSSQGGTLEVDIAVQAIQALGKTDADNEADAVTAVMNAWGIQPDA